jgi:hypothetical protein
MSGEEEGDGHRMVEDLGGLRENNLVESSRFRALGSLLGA